MNLHIITGLGPGHELLVEECQASVRKAIKRPGRFTKIEHVIVDDTNGVLGCAGAKNVGMDRSGADWFFFLDADDKIEPDAFESNNFDDVATFGAVKLLGRWEAWKDVYPCGWREIAINGAGGTLIMGFFCRADVANILRFDEADDVTDDFEFFLRLPSFTKIDRPLCTKRTETSAGGPRRVGHATVDWTGRCNEMIRRAVKRSPGKFGVEPDLVLSNVAPH